MVPPLSCLPSVPLYLPPSSSSSVAVSLPTSRPRVSSHARLLPSSRRACQRRALRGASGEGTLRLGTTVLGFTLAGSCLCFLAQRRQSHLVGRFKGNAAKNSPVSWEFHSKAELPEAVQTRNKERQKRAQMWRDCCIHASGSDPAPAGGEGAHTAAEKEIKRAACTGQPELRQQFSSQLFHNIPEKKIWDMESLRTHEKLGRGSCSTGSGDIQVWNSPGLKKLDAEFRLSTLNLWQLNTLTRLRARQRCYRGNQLSCLCGCTLPNADSSLRHSSSTCFWPSTLTRLSPEQEKDQSPSRPVQGDTWQTLRFRDSLCHHLAALLWNDRVGRRQKVRSGDAERWDDTFWVGGNYSPPPPGGRSYLLVLWVLRPEVTAHNLEFHVEMGQPMKQVDPPRRGVIHHGSHLWAAARQRSLRSQLQNSHADTGERQEHQVITGDKHGQNGNLTNCHRKIHSRIQTAVLFPYNINGFYSFNPFCVPTAIPLCDCCSHQSLKSPIGIFPFFSLSLKRPRLRRLNRPSSTTLQPRRSLYFACWGK